MNVTMLGTEQSRADAGETVWRVEHDGRDGIISHLHDAVVRANRRGGAWYAVARADVGTIRVYGRDFAAALEVARMMLLGGAL